MSKTIMRHSGDEIKGKRNGFGVVQPLEVVGYNPNSETMISSELAENVDSVDCDYGLIGIAFEISRQRRDTLLQLMDALDQSDWPKAKALARRLCGK